jgi:signal transduction histidine kinase
VSLRLKTILGIATIEAILLLLLISMTLDYLRETNYEGLIKRASTTATLFATTSKNAVLSYDLASLESFVDEVLKNPDLVYARVLGPGEQVFAEAGEANALAAPFHSDTEVDLVNDSIFDTYADIGEGGEIYGRVEIGLDIKSLKSTIDEAQNKSATIAALEMSLVALFSLILGTYLTRQLKFLSAAAKSISSGDLGVQIPVKGQDEIAEVASAFNAMAFNLKEASERRDEVENQLKELNRSLEERVSQRTEELVLKNSELEHANREIKDAQAKLLQSEKMASVGVLAAGVAHEINNPLGFVISNLTTLENYVNNYRILVAEYQQLFELKDSSARKEQYQRIQQSIEDFDLEFMNDDLTDLLRDTQEGSVRVKEIVKGLKAFSHIDQSDEMQLADINECITTTLKVANNEFKYHCQLDLQLAELPHTYCLPGQIKQVLLNLFMNASQAIQEKGVINVSSSLEGDNIEISVRDNGCGIPKESISKLFDPFFTTKEVGEGTGLGLAISYGIIVDEHKGDIRVNSVEGEGTCFTVVLPLKANLSDSTPSDD